MQHSGDVDKIGSENNELKKEGGFGSFCFLTVKKHTKLAGVNT
jgi:hypothetical protein